MRGQRTPLERLRKDVAGGSSVIRGDMAALLDAMDAQAARIEALEGAGREALVQLSFPSGIAKARRILDAALNPGAPDA